MHGGDDARRELGAEQLAALARDAKTGPEDRLRRGCAETDEDARPNDAQFRLEPGPASGKVTRAWFLVDAPFAARFPFEVLDRVGDVNRVAIDPRFLERAVENIPGRPDERFPGQIFSIAGLFAEQHESRAFAAFAEHGLGRIFVKRAGGAMRGRFA